MPDQKVSEVKPAERAEVSTGVGNVLPPGVSAEQAGKDRKVSLAEKAEVGKPWHPLAGTGSTLGTDSVVIHNPDVDAPVVVVKGQRVAFESEDYKVHKAPDPGV